MSYGQPGTSSATQASRDRAQMFRLQMLILDGGRLVLRSYVDQIIAAMHTTLSACLINEKSTITRLRGNNTITKVQHDLLFPSSGNVSTSDLDITLLVCLLRNLKCFGLSPKFNWNTLPVPGDTSIEAAIYNLKRYRNQISHAATTTGIQLSTFKSLWKEIKDILLGINSFSAKPIPDLKQIIKEFKSTPLDPEIEKRVQDEIKNWRKLEKAVEVDLSIVKVENRGLRHKINMHYKAIHDQTRRHTENRKRTAKEVREVKKKIAKLEKENKNKEFLTQELTEYQYQHRKHELKKHLIKFYKRKQSTVPLSPLIEEKDTPLAEFYVMADLVLVKQTSLTSGKEEKIPMKSLRDLFTTGNSGQQEIYLSADAGFGKSSFSKYLAITWCQACSSDDSQYCNTNDELEALASFDFLFLILLRDVTAVCNINEMIEQQIIAKLPKSASLCPLQDILEREKCLIILDGLDEWTHPNNGCFDQNEKIPHRYANDNCVILTTTRPWKLGVLNLKTSEMNKKVEIVQLSKESSRQLEKNAIRKMLGVDDDNELRRNYWDFDKVIAKQGLENFRTIPLLLIYITCLWCNKIPIGGSKVDIYIKTIEFLLSRTTHTYPDVHQTAKSPHCDIPEYLTKYIFCRKFYTLISALAELAYHTLYNDKREHSLVFDGSAAEKYLKTDDMKFCFLSGILTESTTTTLIERMSKVSFSHKTVHEFFAAIFISSQIDGQNIVLEKCKDIQSILDISMLCEFLSKMNYRMMLKITTGFISLINMDRETLNYRSRTGVYVYDNPLYKVQKQLLSCMKEMPENENTKLCLQDFFINRDSTTNDKHLQLLTKVNKTIMKSLDINISYDTSTSLRELIEMFSLEDLDNLQKLFYDGAWKNTDLSVLLFPSLRTVSLSFAIWSHFEGNLSVKLGALKNVQYLDIRHITISHEIFDILINCFSGIRTMQKLSLERLLCKEHGRDCKRNIYLSKHNQLKQLVLSELPPLQINLISESLVGVELRSIKLSDNSSLLSRDMLNIDHVVLKCIEIPAAGFQELINVLEDLPQSVIVEMDNCNIKPETTYKSIKDYIKRAQSFVVTLDSSEFKFKTRKLKKSKIIE